MPTTPRSFSGDALAHAARAARLEITSDRAAFVGPTVEAIYALIDQLDEVPLGETPPATAFDARWGA
jgi:Asp-tRNA(Asn)/Glu-tRNA(Gln) amidotransferase C subunit